MENGESSWRDGLGIAASALCAVHCAATPILLACLPTLQFTEWMASPQFHQIAAMICVSLVSISIWPAFHRHRDYRVLGLSTAGLALILGAAFLLPDSCCSSCCSTDAGTANITTIATKTTDHVNHDHATSEAVGSEAASNDLALAGFGSAFFVAVQPWMTPFGGLFLIAAHFLNLRRGFSVCQTRCDCGDLPVAGAELPASQAA